MTPVSRPPPHCGKAARVFPQSLHFRLTDWDFDQNRYAYARMHRPFQTAVIATACLAALGYGLRRETGQPPIIALAFASDDVTRPDAPVLRNKTTTRTENQRRHMNRLYDKMDEDFYDSRLAPLLFDGFLAPAQQATEHLQFGAGSPTASEILAGRTALSSLARKLDFDSAAGTFPAQSRSSAAPISIWLAGNHADLENRITGSGYDPGLSGDTISIDSGVDYLIDDGLVLGLGLGWGSTVGESSTRGLRYQENNLALSPYFVSRVTDWFNLRGSLTLGQSTIRQSEIGSMPDNLHYADRLDSTLMSNTIGFGSDYEFDDIPLRIQLDGDIITAREYVDGARATDGGLIPGSTATTQVFDTSLEARYRFAFGDHHITPFAGQEETVSLLNQDYGRSGSTRYYAGSDYTYDPLNFDLSIQGFRDIATGVDDITGIRSEFSLMHDVARSSMTLRPFIDIESTNLYLDTGGGITQQWGSFPGSVSFELRRKLTYEITQGNYSGLLTIDVPF